MISCCFPNYHPKPAIGYCQAMNFVALFLLRSTDYNEHDAFLLLLMLAEKVVPGYWNDDMSGTQADMHLLRSLVALAMPELNAHLQRVNLPLDLFASQWLVSLFSYALPPLTVCRVWDWLFLDGPTVLLSVTLALLRRAQSELLQLDDLQQVSRPSVATSNMVAPTSC